MTAIRILLLLALGLSASICIPHGRQRPHWLDPLHDLQWHIEADSIHIYAAGDGKRANRHLARLEARVMAETELMQAISTKYSQLIDLTGYLSDSSPPIIGFSSLPVFPDLPGDQNVNLEAITVFYENIEKVRNVWIAVFILNIHRAALRHFER